MPRYARRQSKSNVYHIMIRGNERKNVFLDDEDRTRFLDTLQKMNEDCNYDLYAYCLMDNHVHLLMRERKDSIQRSMKRICVSYVYYFNKKYQRIGHLFQDRFRSEAVEEDRYILAAVTYIHNNPVKAKIVAKAEDYKWSSYRQYINPDGNKINIVERNFLLSMLFDEEGRALELFKEMTDEPIEKESIEYENLRESRKRGNASELKNAIVRILEAHGQSLESFRICTDKVLRNRLINEIKGTTNASIRDLSRITGISKDIIFRV